MGSKNKEDERNEKAIRSLLKLPENRRCINCNSLGPQYVCSTFLTFVCINCSGIHREFTHRVKSISMAKFTAEEVNALRAGGNERARQIYFKEWDTRRDGYPDGSNIFKLRDFIRSVYVEKRYSSESNDNISQSKPAVIEEHKASTGFFGSRSFHSLDKSEIERTSSGGRSGNETVKFYFDEKKHKQQQQQQHVPPNPKSRGLPKSPIRFEIVDDRFRDDGSVKRYDMRRESRASSKSLDFSNNKDTRKFPIVRQASDRLVETDPRLRGGNAVKVEKKMDPVNSQNLGSLIDDVPPVSEPSNENISQTSDEPPATRKTIEYPAPNSLEALLFGLSVPSAFSGTNNSIDSYPEAKLGTQEMPKTPDSTITVSHTDPSGPEHPVADDNLNTKDIVASPSVAASNQVEPSTPPKEQSVYSMEQSPIDNSNSALVVECEQPHQDETQSSIRSALPEDLFTGGFSFASPQVHGQHHGMGYGMQYYQYPVNTNAFTYTAKSSNPFDLSCDDDHTSPNQAPQFPSMAYGQGGNLPQVLAPSSSLAADYIGLGVMPSHSPSYAAALSPTSPSLASNLSHGAYIGQQQSHVNMSPSFRSQEMMNGFSTAENTFNNAHSFHQTNPNAYISRRNPFE